MRTRVTPLQATRPRAFEEFRGIGSSEGVAITAGRDGASPLVIAPD